MGFEGCIGDFPLDSSSVRGYRENYSALNCERVKCWGWRQQWGGWVGGLDWKSKQGPKCEGLCKLYHCGRGQGNDTF